MRGERRPAGDRARQRAGRSASERGPRDVRPCEKSPQGLGLVSRPPRKRRKWARRAAVLALVLALVALAVYMTVRPYDAIDLNHSIGFSVGVRIGPGAGARSDPSPDEALYATPEEALSASGWLKKCSFVSGPLAVEQDDDSVALLYFCDLGPNAKNKTEFAVARVDKKDGQYLRPSPSSSYAFTDTDMESDGKYLYKTPEAKVAFYMIDRLAENLPVPKRGFQYFGASEDPGIKDMTILGRRPSGVVEYSYEGKSYYFWYYDGFDFAGYLGTRKDFSLSGFTTRDLIDALDVEFPQ